VGIVVSSPTTPPPTPPPPHNTPFFPPEKSNGMARPAPAHAGNILSAHPSNTLIVGCGYLPSPLPGNGKGKASFFFSLGFQISSDFRTAPAAQRGLNCPQVRGHRNPMGAAFVPPGFDDENRTKAPESQGARNYSFPGRLGRILPPSLTCFDRMASTPSSRGSSCFKLFGSLFLFATARVSRIGSSIRGPFFSFKNRPPPRAPDR